MSEDHGEFYFTHLKIKTHLTRIPPTDISKYTENIPKFKSQKLIHFTVFDYFARLALHTCLVRGGL